MIDDDDDRLSMLLRCRGCSMLLTMKMITCKDVETASLSLGILLLAVKVNLFRTIE